jgi:hypothetical protein
MERLALLGAAAVLAACSSTLLPPDLGGGQTTIEHEGGAGDEPIPSSSVSSYTAKVGGTLPVGPGQQVGYALTLPKDAMSYQLRWTGDAAVAGDGFQEFYGSVWTTGHFTSLTPGCLNAACPLESGDYVSGVIEVAGGERIDWDTVASTGWDGFSFTTDTEPIYFDIYIDGRQHPEVFFFASTPDGTTSTPASTPFGMSSSP